MREGEPRTPTTQQGDWWIALNIVRTRVSLLGFNLTLIAFMVGLLLSVHEEQVFTHHMPATAALFLAFCLSILAAGCLLASQELDAHGHSRPWLFAVGDLLMYLALSQSVAALTRKQLGAMHEGLREVSEAHGPTGLGGVLVFLLGGLGLLAWLFCFYVGPLVSIARSRVRRNARWVLALVYVAMVAGIIAVATEAHLLQDVVLDDPEPTLRIVLWQFLQPLTWA